MIHGIGTVRRARSTPDRVRRRRALRARLSGQRGASPVELAILMPGILFLLFASIQVAAIYLARTAALSAAQEAVTAQRMYQAQPGDGVQRANAFLAQAGDWLGHTEVTGGVDDDRVSFTVTGDALSLIPWYDFRVSETAHGPVERFTTEADG